MSKKLKIIIPIVLIILIICFIIFKKSIGNNKIVGKWSLDNNTTYEFYKNGKGQFIVPSGTYKFSYKIHNNIISFDFENPSSEDLSYKYKIDNDNLELIKENDNKVKYIFKKVK